METPPAVLLSLHAMATRFELVLYGDNPIRLRAAGEEALQEIERLDSQLSFYSATSEITRINSRAGHEPVKVEPRLLNLLRDCVELTSRTDGAFDISVGPLMRAWGFFGREGRVPPPPDLEAVRSKIGIENLELDDDASTVRFKRGGVELDLGAYAKGYAIDRAMTLLKDNGVASALLHGGSSSVCCVGAPIGCDVWQVGLHDLFNSSDGAPRVNLCDAALSVSAIHGKSFKEDTRAYGHVLDPRTCTPISEHLAAVVVGASSALCEALSTALLVNGPAWLPVMIGRFPGCEGMIAFRQAGDDVKVEVARSPNNSALRAVP